MNVDSSTDKVFHGLIRPAIETSQALGLLIIVVIVLLLSRSGRRLGWHR